MIETIATVLSIVGAVLMSSNNKHSKYAYLLWPFASICWLYVAMDAGLKGLVITQIIYMILEFTGLWKWVIRDRFALTKRQK